MRVKSIISLLFIASSSLILNAQTSNQKQVDAINAYVHFVNESTHGLLIAHRLFELYNQDINKYVDLPGYKLNNYSNDDLPANIFEDPENWFYDTSPYEWYATAKEQSVDVSQSVSKKLNTSLDKLKTILDQINEKRLEVPIYIQSHNMEDTLQLQGVYDRLERCVDLYDDFFDEQTKLELLLKLSFDKIADNSTYQDLYIKLNEIHTSSKTILRALRKKEDKGFSQKIGKLSSQYARLTLNEWSTDKKAVLSSSQYARRKNNILSKLSEINREAKKYYETAEVPEEYKLYGKFYFYHNSDIINKMNRYGNGYVFEANNLFKFLRMSVLFLTEEPHYYKVIYPEKLKKENVIVSSDDEIEILPEKLKDRQVVTSNHTILVDSMQFNIELFDHMIQDGDIVSINFNGDWILENLSLEAKPSKLKIQLNKTGKNYLLLHAENIGKRPPNTMGVSYYYKGKKEKITLKSDLNASEMIEIQYQPE
jgi:hypothetical protein